MKKIFALICTVSLLVIAMTSCEHEHLFKSEWDSDSEYHWHECGKKNKCEEQSDRAKHDFVLEDGSDDVYKCSVCGYKKTDDDAATDGDPVGYKVSGADEWDSLVGALSFTNFTIEIKFVEPGFEYNKRLILTEQAVFYCEGTGSGHYYLKNSDGMWETYISNGIYCERITDSDEMESPYEAKRELCTILVSLAGNFDKFTYNAQDGTYTCRDTLNATLGAVDGEQAYCRNVVLTFTEDGVASLSAEYYFDTEEETRYYFSYSDIGTSEVTIPECVADVHKG